MMSLFTHKLTALRDIGVSPHAQGHERSTISEGESNSKDMHHLLEACTSTLAPAGLGKSCCT